MPGLQFARAAGRPEIRYCVEGKGPFVTLVHGVGANLESWDAVTGRLASRFTIVRMDLRGHGRSGRITTPITLDDLAADVRLVWDHLAIARSHLVGFSLGGLIAQSLALSDARRIDRLVILSAVADRSPAEREKVVSRLKLLAEGGIAAVSAAAEERWFTADFRARHPERIAARMKELLANDPASYAAAYTVFATGDLGHRVHEIKHATLIATGEHDVGSNVRMARFMHERIAGSRLHILPGLRHSVLVEAPDQVAAMVAEFLEAGRGAA